MNLLSKLSFPYNQTNDTKVTLNKLILTDSEDFERIIIPLNENKYVDSITKQETQSHKIIDEQISYIQNVSGDDEENESEIEKFPLLIKIDPNFNKFKLHVSIKPENDITNRVLLIVKSNGINNISKLSKIIENEENNSNVEISKIEYKQLPIDENLHEFQKLIINDFFNKNLINNTKLTISIFEQDLNSKEIKYFLKFSLWINEYHQLPLKSINTNNLTNNFTNNSATSHTNSPTTQKSTTDSTLSSPSIYKTTQQNIPEPLSYSLGDFRKEFSFNIEDGPEFRKTLTKYEETLPTAKKVYSSLIDDFKLLESNVRRITTCKYRIMEEINQLCDLESDSLLQEFGFKKDFQLAFKNIFDSFEKNINFFFDNICDNKLFTKILNNISSQSGENPNQQSELIQMKKQFENDSKEYYAWLNKYLSNDKERPESKLLLKKKTFELSKFDYLNQLSKITNNQYVNELIEKLFKFINLKNDPANPNLLNFKIFLDKKNSNQLLLSNNYQIYLYALTRFNSEKYQFRQMIEASQSSEELTNLIRYNRLTHKTSANSNITTDDFLVTKENFDLIFSDINPPNDQQQHQIENDSEKSGILFTLGGQKKTGWHKEWVVLKNGQLIEFSDWRKGKTPINKPIEIALSNVKAVNHDKRQFCFEIITSTNSKHVFQAFDNEDRNKWVKALYNAGQLVNTDRLQQRFGNSELSSSANTNTNTKSNKKHITKIITDFGSKPIIPGQTTDRSISPISITSKDPFFNDNTDTTDNNNNLNLVRSIPNSNNNQCIDCNSFEQVEWVSINFLICMCINCASCHRNLGSHITKIRSLKLDLFENESKILLNYINNSKVNSYMEFNLESQQKINSNSNYENRLNFIKLKYIDKSFIEKLSNVNNFLFSSIQKISIHDELKGILCGGDINLNLQIHTKDNREDKNDTNDNKDNDKDKDDIQIISLYEYSLKKYIQIENDPTNKKYFVASELLILNGCTNIGSTKGKHLNS
ncbi:AGE1 [Candida pseudojiufengensis]|uniref:AGE1 n=1 Tax=Candida pseudojiufengensis TaxID=497109 RepID=UPI0022249AEA|nr:AGE1 [Candida pseudojiufengensis]KAI5966269.1 AGE1 [Candida pseudojiufengensis]